MTGGSLTVLVVEDDLFTRTLVAGALRGAGHTVIDVDAVRHAMKALSEHDFHLVVSDLNLGNGPSGADLLNRIHDDQPWVGMIALTSHASPELAIGPLATLPRGTVYLVKSELREIDSLFAAMERALSGEQQPKVQVTEDGRTVVTRSQAEVLRMLSAGYATSVIAEQRSTTVRAAEMMIQRLYDKLGLKESSDLDPRTGAVLLWQQGRVRVN